MARLSGTLAPKGEKRPANSQGLDTPTPMFYSTTAGTRYSLHLQPWNRSWNLSYGICGGVDEIEKR
jgi:hypothetical protein